MEPQPELHPDRLKAQTEWSAPSESQKLTHRQNGYKELSREEAQAAEQRRLDWLSIDHDSVITHAWIVLLVLTVISSFVWVGRLGVASQWENLMDASGFVDWQPIGGIQVQSVASSVYVVAMVVAQVAKHFCWSASRVRYLRVLSKVCLWTAIASVIGFLSLIIGWIAVDRIPGDMVMDLASQPVAVAKFNQGYCLAWHRQTNIPMPVGLQRRGVDQATVFDEIVGKFDVGNWCTEAIVKQVFDVDAAYEGVSPFASFQRRPRVLAMMVELDALALFNGFVAFYLFVVWTKIEKALKDVDKDLQCSTLHVVQQ